MKYPWSKFPGLKTAFIIAELESQKKMGITDPKATDAVELKAEIMAEAVKDWMVEQELTITEMKASLEVEEIKTSDTIDADIKPTRDLKMLTLNLTIIKEVVMLIVSPIKKMGDVEIGGVKPFAFLAAMIVTVETWFKNMGRTMSAQIPPGNGQGEITNPAVNYSKNGADGGRLTASGHAYIGAEANIVSGNDLTTDGNGITKVQLLEDNIKNESMT